MRVVIVDDALFMRIYLRDKIENLGHTVVGEATNGEEAIDIVIATEPDIVTLDITMPIMGGIDALPIIKREYPHMIVAMVSAMGQLPMIKEAVDLGADDFLIKPFNHQELVEFFNKHHSLMKHE